MNQSSPVGHATSFRPNHHYEELDSLRGLAAITVLIAHYSNLFMVQSGPYVRVGEFVQSVRRTPLFAVFAGHEAVMLFFVLSGFVLSLQFLKGKPVDYGSFAIKRIFRIYVPYLIALGVAVTCCKFLYSGRIDELSDLQGVACSTISSFSEAIKPTGSIRCCGPSFMSCVFRLCSPSLSRCF
jgi:peptidoglycan/LPS O-acetylase OafA/YrhL